MPPAASPGDDRFLDEGEASALPGRPPQVTTLARGVGRYRQVMDVTGLNNAVVSIDSQLTSSEEHAKSLYIMKRQRRWIRFLCIIGLALAVDVIFLSINLTKIKKESEQQQQQGQENTSSNETAPNWRPLPSSEQLITTLAFGSCSSQHMPQPYLDTVVRLSPDLLIFGGDNVYGECQEETCEELKDAYWNWTQLASFQGAIQRVPIIATLDDYDYGMKYAHNTNPYKRIAKDLFHKFYPHLQTAVPNDEDDGVYQMYTWGPLGKRVQVILLDTRYHRDAFPRNYRNENSVLVPPEAPFKPATSASPQMLSPRQWDWLAQVLQQPDVQIRFLVSSIQVLNDGTGFECWRHFPSERERLYNLLRYQSTSPIYLLSGDRQVGGFYQVDFKEDDNVTSSSRSGWNRQSLSEVTASSWTHTIPYGAFDNCSDASTCDEDDPSRIGDLVRENNFATLHIDWERGSLTVALRRAETPPAFLYHGQHHEGMDSTGQILQARSYQFL